MKIEKENRSNKKKIESFSKKEWGKFNDENNYHWDENKQTFAAIEKGKVLGYFYFKINGGAGYLSQLLVAKKSRGKGVGKKMIEKFENILKEKGCHVAYIDTSEKHVGALKFYESLGYKKVATLKKNKFGFDWYYFEKRLK